MKGIEKVTILKDFEIFASLSEDEITDIVQKMHEEEFSSGQILIQQGGEDSQLYFIYEGMAKIYRTTEDGSIITVGLAGIGNIVGEMAFIDQTSRSASVEAMQQVSVFVLSAKDFDYYMHKYPDIAIALLRVFSKRLRDNNENIEEITSHNLNHRTQMALQTLSNYFPDQTITLSQQELAEIVGATRARITEVLNELKKEGKVELSQRKIRVL